MSYQIEYDMTSTCTVDQGCYVRNSRQHIDTSKKLNNFNRVEAVISEPCASSHDQPCVCKLDNMTLKGKWEAFTTRIGLNRLVDNFSNWIHTEDKDDYPPEVYISE